MRKVESIWCFRVEEGGMPRRTWDELLTTNMRNLSFEGDMVLDRSAWRFRIRLSD